MPDPRSILEREERRIELPADAFERLQGRLGRRRRNRRLSAGLVGIAVFAGALTVLLTTFLGGPVPGAASGTSVTHGHTRATVTIVHRHLKNAQVDLYPIPSGYTPRIDAGHALRLALAQLNPSLRIRHAHLYLGEFQVYGTAGSATPAWVMVVGPSPSWCQPMFGPGLGVSPPPPSAHPSSCTFGVVIDANTGGLIVEGP